MFDTISEKAVTLAVGALGALGAYLGGVRSGKAQFITAASTAADLMLGRQAQALESRDGAISRLELRLDEAEQRSHRSAERERDCQREVAELRELIAEDRRERGLAPFHFKAARTAFDEN